MTKEEAMKIAKDGLHIFDQRYEEEGDSFLCDFFDALTEEEINVDVDNFSQEKYEDFAEDLVFSEHFVAQSNDEIDDYNDDYFKDPKPLVKVITASQDPMNPGNLEFSWYWLTMDGRDEIKKIIEKYTNYIKKGREKNERLHC